MVSARNQNIVQWLLVFVILVMLNVVAQFIRLRADLTADKRFTLSESTKELLRSLDDRLLVKVYLEGEFPSGFRRLRNETRLLLDEFRTLNDNIEFQFINPSESREENERLEVYQQLAEKGLEPTRLQSNEGDSKKEQLVFPGALLYYQNREQGVMLLKSRMGAFSRWNLNWPIPFGR
jgi:ABC-2 type transport system permease protein